MTAIAFCEYDQVLTYNPTGEEIPENSFFVQFGITMVGPPAEVPNGRMDGAVQILVVLGDTLTTVQNKIRQSCVEWAANSNVVLRGMDLVIPAYQKG